MILHTNNRRLHRQSSLVVFRCTVSLVLVFFTSLAIASEYTVHVGPNGYDPFSMIEKRNGRFFYSGIMFDLLDAFEAEHPEFTRKHILLTRKRANAKMARGEDFDLMFNSPLFVSDEILQHYHFTKTLFVSKDVVVTRSDQNFVYQKPEDLYSKTVGAIRGYSYGDFDTALDSDLIRDVRVDHHTQAIGMLAKKRIDAYLGNIHVSPLYIKQLGFKVSDFTFSDIAMYEFYFAFAVNKRRTELYKKLNAFIEKAHADGTLDTVIKGYIE